MAKAVHHYLGRNNCRRASGWLATSDESYAAAFDPTSFRRASTADVEDAGFWPVMRRPSVIEKGRQFGKAIDVGPCLPT